MKRILLLCSLLLAVSMVPAHAATITLDAPTVVNGLFDISVNATGVFDPPHDADALVGFGFDVNFNSAVLSYVGASIGSLFTSFPDPHPGAQVEAFANSIFLNPGDFTEPLNLAVLHFAVIGFGTATVGVTGDPLNPDQGLAYLGGTDAISASAQVTATPEPGTVALGGIGAGLLLLGWRKPR